MPLLSWAEHNDTGLRLADSHSWEAAATAFEQAQLAVAGDDEACALLLGNEAAAHFHRGELHRAMDVAMQSLDFRVARWGVGSIISVRAQSDLAVILCANGRLVEARALLDTAIATVETEKGTDAPELVQLLGNASRVALADGDFARAEPLVLRLHAVLDAHGQPTGEADALFERIARARTAQPVPDTVVRPAVERPPIADFVDVADFADVTTEVAGVAEVAEVPEVADLTEVAEVVVAATAGAPMPPTAPPAAQARDRSPSVDSAIVPEPLPAELYDLDLVEPAPPTLDHVPAHRRHVHHDDDSLGFVVQHGVPVTPDAPLDVFTDPAGPLPALARHSMNTPLSMPSQVPQRAFTQPMDTARSLSAMHGGVPASAQLHPVVLPTPVRPHAGVDHFTETDSASEVRNMLHMHTAPAPARAVRSVNSGLQGSVLQDRPRIRASGGARVWLVVGGGLAAVTAVVGLYVLRALG